MDIEDEGDVDEDDEEKDETGRLDWLEVSSDTCPLRKYRTKKRRLLAMTPISAAANGRMSRTKFCTTEAEDGADDEADDEDDGNADGSAFKPLPPVAASALSLPPPPPPRRYRCHG